MSSIKRDLEIRRTALALLRAAASDDDAGLAALQATVDDARDGQAIALAVNQITAEGLRPKAASIGFEAFCDAYARALDRTERQLTGS
jgi:hypothetical protein